MTPHLKRLDKWLSKHRSRFQKNLQPAIATSDLQAMSKSLGTPIPDELQTLLSWHNGQGDEYVGYFIDHWLLMDAAAIATAKEELDATGEEYGWNKAWIPFLDDDGGNYVVLDTSKKPAPVLAFWMGEQTEQLAPSLEAWLGEFVTDVEAGKYYQDPERGTFSKSKG